MRLNFISEHYGVQIQVSHIKFNKLEVFHKSKQYDGFLALLAASHGAIFDDLPNCRSKNVNISLRMRSYLI